MNKLVAMSLALLLGGMAVSTGAQTPPNHPWHPRPGAQAAPGAPPAVNAPATAQPAAHSVLAGAYSTVPVKKTSEGEQFFIVASLDLQKSQLLLKYPTEVTLLVKATDQTKFVNDSGKPIKFSDLRAGDTLWLTSKQEADGTVALKVRKGEMSVADLHHYYLDYPEIK